MSHISILVRILILFPLNYFVIQIIVFNNLRYHRSDAQVHKKCFSENKGNLFVVKVEGCVKACFAVVWTTLQER